MISKAVATIGSARGAALFSRDQSTGQHFRGGDLLNQDALP